jgi:hypothetical protein
MSGIGITPAVMINRMVHQAQTPGNHLLQVALVRADVVAAARQEQAKAQLLQPEAEARAPEIITGADVDRLI